MRPACFLTWIKHRRTREICRRLDFELVELLSTHRGVLRYLELTIGTIYFLIKRRPRTLIVQSPSIVLATLALLFRPFLRYRLVLDAHNEAVEPFLNRAKPVLILTRLLLRCADQVVVTNQQLAEIVRRMGGIALILPDPIPKAPGFSEVEVSVPFKVAVVSTYAPDEPLAEVLDAARAAGPDYSFFVTGDPSRYLLTTRQVIPDNVVFTGYLQDHDYWNLISSSNAVLDLTTMDNCLVCGAYEALAAGVPAVLSQSAASLEIFGEIAEHTENNWQAILSALVRIRSRHAELLSAIPVVREKYEQKWETLAQTLADADRYAGTV